MQLLASKVAVVTGADSGIGQAMAEAFARAGAAAVCVGYHRDRDGAEETCRRVEAAGSRALAAPVDVGASPSVDAFFAQAAQALGTPDILAANAGIGTGGIPVADLDDATVERVLRTDLIGPLLCARAFVRLRTIAGGQGRIVMTGSVDGHLPTPGSAPYGMAKAGVNSLVRSLSVEVASDRINVNAIAPGYVETPMTRSQLNDPAQMERILRAIPWGRVARPEEVAGLAVFLLSDAADYVTGQTWVMDGGMTMHWGGA